MFRSMPGISEHQPCTSWTFHVYRAFLGSFTSHMQDRGSALPLDLGEIQRIIRNKVTLSEGFGFVLNTGKTHIVENVPKSWWPKSLVFGVIILCASGWLCFSGCKRVFLMLSHNKTFRYVHNVVTRLEQGLFCPFYRNYRSNISLPENEMKRTIPCELYISRLSSKNLCFSSRMCCPVSESQRFPFTLRMNIYLHIDKTTLMVMDTKKTASTESSA